MRLKMDLQTEYELIWSQVKPRVLMSDVIRAVSLYTGEPTPNLLADRRNQPLVWTRWAAFYICRQLCTASYPQIGKAFRKDHTTVIYGCLQMDKMIQAHVDVRAHVEAMQFLAEKTRDDRINKYKSAA